MDVVLQLSYIENLAEVRAALVAARWCRLAGGTGLAAIYLLAESRAFLCLVPASAEHLQGALIDADGMWSL